MMTVLVFHQVTMAECWGLLFQDFYTKLYVYISLLLLTDYIHKGGGEPPKKYLCRCDYVFCSITK